MSSTQNTKPQSLIWRDPAGKPISCTEKVKVLRENHEELRQQLQDCFEDALLMGCDEEQFRQILDELVKDLVNPYNDIS